MRDVSKPEKGEARQRTSRHISHFWTCRTSARCRMSGAAVRVGDAVRMSLKPRLELAAGLDEVTDNLDDNSADPEGFAVDVLGVGGVTVQLDFDLPGQRDITRRRRPW